jgi:hypothetical protein
MLDYIPSISTIISEYFTGKCEKLIGCSLVRGTILSSAGTEESHKTPQSG